MKDLEQHKNQFNEIIKKYNLSSEERAQEIAKFLTTNTRQKVDAKEFAELFGMAQDEAKIFLSFIQKGIQFKEEHIDKK